MQFQALFIYYLCIICVSIIEDGDEEAEGMDTDESAEKLEDDEDNDAEDEAEEENAEDEEDDADDGSQVWYPSKCHILRHYS